MLSSQSETSLLTLCWTVPFLGNINEMEKVENFTCLQATLPFIYMPDSAIFNMEIQKLAAVLASDLQSQRKWIYYSMGVSGTQLFKSGGKTGHVTPIYSLGRAL